MISTVFNNPIFPGAKIVTCTATVTNVSGSYSQSFTDERVATGMIAQSLEIGDPSIFKDKISVLAGAGQFTISCANVVGTSTIKIYFLKVLDDPTEITSTEFDILDNRITEVNNNLASLSEQIGTLNTFKARFITIHETLSFSNGIANKQITGSKAGTIVLVNRDISMASSLTLDGCWNGSTTITFTCYNTDNKTNYTGNVTINALVIIPE